MIFIVRHGTLVAGHPHVAILYTRGCLRNYVLVFAKKREGFCEMKNRISPI